MERSFKSNKLTVKINSRFMKFNKLTNYLPLNNRIVYDGLKI